MSSAGKATTAIGTSEAQQMAQEFLSRLAATPDEAGPVADDFCQRYSWASRRDILEHVAAELSRRDVAIPAEAWHRFLTFSGEGVKANKVVDHLGVVFTVALASSREGGAALAGRLLFDQIRSAPDDPRQPGHLGAEDEHLERVGDLRRAGAVVTAALRQAQAEDALTERFLLRWQRTLARLVGRRAAATGRCLSAEEAGEVLAILGRLDPSSLPDELLLFCPRLAALAGLDASRSFFGTAVGRQLRDLLPPATPAAEPPPAPASPLSPPPAVQGSCPSPPMAEWEAALLKARELIHTEIRRSERGAAPVKELDEAQGQLKALREELGDVRKARGEAEEELARARQRLGELRTQADELESQRQELTRRSREAEEKVSRWVGEAGRREAELTAGFADQERRQVEQLRQLLAGTTRDLHGYVQDVLVKHRGDNLVRKMGVTFDQLHRDLLGVLQQPSEPRLPRELLTRTDQEPRRDEQ